MYTRKWSFMWGFFIVGSFLLSDISLSQITISWPDPSPVGRVTEMNIDTVVSVESLNLGVSGGPQTWNFDETLDAWDVNFGIMDVAGSPYEATFGDAQWVDHNWTYIPEFLDPPTIGEMFSYRYLEGGWIKEEGMGTTATLIGGSPFVYPSPSQVYPNPLEYDSPTWTEKRYFEPEFIGLIDGTIEDSSIVSVDAWGELTISTGTYQCLRLKRHEFREIHIPPVPFVLPGGRDEYLETYTYVWLTQDFETVLSVTADASLGEDFTEALYVILATNLSGIGCDPTCEPDASIPSAFVLGQNYPNPFNPTTSIQYALPEPAQVELKIFSLLGQEIALIESGIKSAGVQETVWDGNDSHHNGVPGGVYFYQLKAIPLSGNETIVQTRKMVMMK